MKTPPKILGGLFLLIALVSIAYSVTIKTKHTDWFPVAHTRVSYQYMWSDWGSGKSEDYTEVRFQSAYKYDTVDIEYTTMLDHQRIEGSLTLKAGEVSEGIAIAPKERVHQVHVTRRQKQSNP